ncbi:MAG: AAA family ATPase [Erythrobacter sp.]
MTTNVVSILATQPHDPQQACDALALIFGDRPWQVTALDPGTGAEDSATFAPHDRAGVSAWLARQSAANCYFGHAERKPDAARRRREDIAAVHWLHVDADPRHGEPLDLERTRILALLEDPPEGVAPPSLVIDSGRGYVGLWRLAEPLNDLAAAEGMNRWLAEQLGGDKCHDVSRILRLPGTGNQKPEAQGRRARIISQDAGAVFSADRFGRSAGSGTARRSQDNQAPICELDTPAALARIDAYLATEPGAVEGQGGDAHTLQVAMNCRDMGGSEAAVFDRMAAEWNDKCSPRWELDELAGKIANAYAYAQNAPGSQSPAVDLAGVEPLEPRYVKPAGPTALPVLKLAELGRQYAPERLWAVDGMIPLLKATMLTGRGGVGKSLLAQLLATVTALGAPFLGMATRPAKAAYISWEDDAEELWRRQEAICSALGIPMADLDGKLVLVSMTREPDSLLVTFDAAGNRTVTPRGHQIEAYAVAERLKFIAFDNASHLLGGDHNDIKHVAGFAHWLNSLAETIEGATLLLHHPNKSGDDWLGSVAYENQFRSRLFMDRPLDAVDPNARVLTNPKANYAASGGEVRFRWWRGSFMRDADLPADAVAAINETAQAQHDAA